MPSLQSASRNLPAVLWACTGNDDNGNPVLIAPRQIRVRWETGDHVTKEQTGTVDAIAYVGERITKGSVMWQGKLSDVPAPNVATEFGIVSLFTVIAYNEIPAIKGSGKTQSVDLMRRSSQIPQIT